MSTDVASHNDAFAFIQRAKSDVDLLSRIERVREGGGDALLKEFATLGVEYGFSFTSAGFQQAMEDAIDGEFKVRGELSDAKFEFAGSKSANGCCHLSFTSQTKS